MDDLIELLRLLERDHAPDGWPAVQMRDITALLDALEAARDDAERWRFVTNELSEAYGDGNTEPHECHVHLEWVQGPWIRDGSNGGRGRPDTFPGWNAIVDAKIAQHRLDYDDLDAAIDQARGKAGGEVGNG